MDVEIRQDGIKIDAQKIEAITSISPCRQVATFIGMIAWFSKSLPYILELCETIKYDCETMRDALKK